MGTRHIVFYFSLFFSVITIQAQDILMQDGSFNQCSGFFYDSGGADGDYSTGEDFTLTICPDDSTLISSLSFTSFEVPGVSGTSFEIYDADTADPAQLLGTFSGDLVDNPELEFITASDENPTGCLTIVFQSATFFPESGWAATIGCREPCEETTATITQIVPSDFNDATLNYEIEFFQTTNFQINPDFPDGNGNNPEYIWDFGDGTPTVSTDTPIAQHLYENLGNFTVNVTIIDDFGCENDVLQIPVEVVSATAFFCDDALQFCAGGTALVFPNSSNATGGLNNAESGPDYGCLFDQPYPAWFFIEVATDGDLAFLIEQDTSPDLNGFGLDVDFKIWGPFDSPDGNCNNLNTTTEVPDLPNGSLYDGCSYSAAPIENMGVENAQAGEFYIIVITNFSQNQGYISLQQINEGDPGAGTISCGNLVLGEDIDACEDETITLFADANNADSFEWELFDTTTGDFETIPGEIGPNLTVTAPGGTIRSTVTFGSTVIQDEIEVNFFENPEINNPITELTECSGNLNATFDLTQVNVNSLQVDNPSDFEILYFNTQADADAGDPTLAIDDTTLTSYPGVDNEEIFIRIQNIGNTDCHLVTSFTLFLDEVDIGSNFTDLSECVGSLTDFTFDLTVNSPEALNGQDPTEYSVLYYDNQTDADNNNTANAIPDPANYQATDYGLITIYVVVQNETNVDCFVSGESFTIDVQEGPEITTPPQDLSECGDYTLSQTFDLTQNSLTSLGVANASDFQISYYNTQADADSGTDPILDPANYNPSNTAENIFIRIENTSAPDCFSTDSFDIEIFNVEALQPDPIEVCAQTGNTGQTAFDLTTQNPDIFGPNQDATTHSISYHNAQADADAGVSPIDTPDNYTSTGSPETIWARVQNNADPSCFELVSFDLIIFEQPEILNPPVDLTVCGDFSGTQTFDLTQIDVASLGIPAPSETILSYHTSQADADAGTNAITDPVNFNPSSNPQSLFIRAENTDDNTCFVTESFNLDIFDVEAIQPDNIEVCAQTGNTGQTIFDLTAQNPDVFGPNQDATTHSISYHNAQADANAGISPIDTPDNYTSTGSPETIWARVQNNDDTDCFAVTSFDLIVIEQPEIVTAPIDLSQCGDFSGSQTFDLTQNNITSLGILTPTETALSYHTSAADADTGDSPIADPANYTPSANPQTIFIRTESTRDGGCFVSTSFTIEVFNVEAIQPENIEICDATGASGQSEFNLLQQNAAVLGPNQNATSHAAIYFTSEADAIANASPIPNPNVYINTTNPETIWVRVENNDNPDCFEITSFDIRVFEEPEVVNTPVDILECGDFTGTQTFDLTQNDAAALGILADTSFSYHNTQAEATAGIAGIPDPANYLPLANAETIFIRIENNADTSCFTTSSFNIERFDVEALPGNDLELCDEGSGTATATFDLTSQTTAVLGPNQSLGSHNVSFHLTQNEANTGDNAIATPEFYSNISSPQIIWVRVENIDNPGCFQVSSFLLSVTDSAPINTDISPLIACDDDNDGFFNNFDLSNQDNEIHFGNTDVAITYHLTAADAQNGVGVLASPYANVVENLQTIFFRAVDTNNGCEQFGSFELQVFDSPLLTPIANDVIGCDEDNDGFIFFDLTQVEDEALGSLDPATLEISYHISLADAQTGDNPIAEPENYLNDNPEETLWIRVLDTSNPHGCFDIEAFDIIVEPSPDIINPEPLEVCDDEQSGDLSDEIAVFDLNDKIEEITQGNNEYLVEFFESQADLDNDNPISPIDAYVNTSNPQTLEVRVTGETNGCASFTSLTLVVNPVPSMAPELEPLEICDPDNDGFGEFDLAAAIPDILNNEPDVSITFHLTLADAELGANPIDTSQLFGTNNPDQQTLYVRAENTGPNGDDGTGCFDTRPLDLIVIPSPEIDNLQDLSQCDDESANGFASFDLTQNEALALGNQNPDDVLITYHETQADAEQGINPIAVPSNYTNITNPQLIYVRIEDVLTGCYDLFDSTDDVNNTFSLTVEPLPVINSPSILEVCDDDYTMNPFPQTSFDLTAKEPEIAGVSIVPANLEFSYYESQDDFDNDNPIADPTAYVNTAQPQSIFIKVVDNATENACFDSTVLTISVLPLPSPSETNPDVLRLEACDDDGNDGVAANPFDLTQSGVLIAGSENVSLSYFLSENAALTQDTDEEISDPTAYVNEPELNLVDEDGNPTNVQVIYVRVDNAVPGNFCFVLVPIEIVVYPAPVINPLGEPFAYTLCEDDSANPGQAVLFSTEDITANLWDLTNGSSDVIIPLLDPDAVPVQDINSYTVSYHVTEDEAEEGINPIAPGFTATDGDILFIRITNTGTACFNTRDIAQVQIVIEPRPAIAQENPDDLESVCANAIDTPGSGTFDLTVQDDIINPDDSGDTFVVYYAGMMDYNEGIVIEDPSSFTTTQSPQTIVAEVVNALTLCESSSFVTFELIVDPLPVVDISAFDGAVICIDANGNVIQNEVSPPTIDTGLSDEEYAFVWRVDGEVDPGFTGASIQPDRPGVYAVQVTNIETGCAVDSNTAEIIQSTPPEFNVVALTPSFSGTHVIQVSVVSGSGNFEFRLDDGPWESLPPGVNEIIYDGLAPGLHVVTGRDESFCGTVTREIMLIDYPPFFTPNQDNINDTWNISSLSDQPNAKIYIFDRYGKLLKQITPAGQGWDGTFNGKLMPSQDYWFRVEFTEPTTETQSTFKGHFTLKR